MSVSVLQIFFIKSLLTLPSSILFPYTTLFRSISENKKRKRIDNAIIRCVFLMFSLLSPALLGNYSDRSITKASYRELAFLQIALSVQKGNRIQWNSPGWSSRISSFSNFKVKVGAF